MVKLNRLYTKNGDKGETHLVGGSKVSKDCLRVCCYGEVDELNALLGMLRTLAEQESLSELVERLALIQNELFDAGAELATPAGSEWPTMKQISPEHYTRLEKWIDSITSKLPELKSFVLPGGSPINSWLHLARTVCRRAERSIVALSKAETLSPHIIIYFNRLSDLLFALAREESFRGGAKEYLWVPGGKSE